MARLSRRAASTWSAAQRLPRLRFSDPGLASLKSAARAAVVLPSVFAFADKVIGNPQTALFAAFGSFAMLVLVDFAGPTRSRLVAYVALAPATSWWERSAPETPGLPQARWPSSGSWPSSPG